MEINDLNFGIAAEAVVAKLRQMKAGLLARRGQLLICDSKTDDIRRKQIIVKGAEK